MKSQANPAVLSDPFFSYSRAEEYDSVEKTTGLRVPVRTPDGGNSYLACTLYRPARGGVAVPGRFPGIVIDYFAYHVVHVIQDRRHHYDFFPRRGYNVVVCDVPGAGHSPGVLDQFGPAETLANYDLIEWFAAQAFSDGNIGQHGVSYAGHTTNKVAAMHPPHLKAIVPNCSMADWYEQTIYHGGIRNQSIGYQTWVVPLTSLGGSNLKGAWKGIRRDHRLTYGQHPLYDDYWRAHSVKPGWAQSTVPALITDGWNDRYKGAAIENYLARKESVWLLLGPWAHAKYTGASDAGTLTDTAHQLAWYDYWLKRLPEARLPRQKITSFEMPDDAVSAGWQQYPDWPPPSAKTLRLYFTQDRALIEFAGTASASLQWRVNAQDRGCDPAGGGRKKDIDQARADAAPFRLSFTAAPLRDDIVVTGAVEVNLNVAFSAADGNLVARLMEVLPDGRVRQVSTGWLKASHYKGHDHLERIVPGSHYPMRVRLLPTHWRFRKGSALRISLSSGDVPDAVGDAPAGNVSVTVGGADGCFAEFTALMR